MKLLFVVLLAVMATIFAVDNMHHVDLGLIVGKAVHVRLFFLLLTSFLIGCFSAMLINVYLGARSNDQREKVQGTEEDDFFSE